jgi:hypothetical protein
MTAENILTKTVTYSQEGVVLQLGVKRIAKNSSRKELGSKFCTEPRTWDDSFQ